MYWSFELFDKKYAINHDATTPCLLIPGWGMRGDVFEWLLPGLAQYFVVTTSDIVHYPAVDQKQQFIDELANSIDEPTWIIAWSLGGNFAIELAQQYPEKVLGLCLVSTTPKFINDEHWDVGMPQASWDKFFDGVASNPEKALRRFDALQVRDDADEKNLQHALSEYRRLQESYSQQDLVNGLQLLESFDQRDMLDTLRIPTLWCFGEVDAITNVYTAEEVRQLMPKADIEVFRLVAHLPFLTSTDHFFKSLLDTRFKEDVQNEKIKVAKSFSKAAESYDQSARLQQWVAGQLIEKIEPCDGVLLDAGCGTAYWTTQLVDKAESVVALDIADGMLRYGKKRYDNIDYWLDADLESLPLDDCSMTTIFSSLSVQWCNDMHKFLFEWHRVLKPGGRAYIATLGPKTLFELRESWEKVDSYKHVNDFLPSDKICEQVSHSPFYLKQLKVEHKVIRYDALMDLMKDLKNIGAQTVMNGGVKSLMGKSRFQKAQEAYEVHRDHVGLLPATYEVIFLVLEKA